VTKRTEKKAAPDPKPPIAKQLTMAAVSNLAKSLQKSDQEGTAEMRKIASWILAERARKWQEDITAELTAICAEATTKAINGWKRREPQFEKEIVRAVVVTRTEKQMQKWAEAVAAQVEAEVDERNLISTDVLKSVEFTRPARRNERDKSPHKTDALECLDDEFIAWFVTQMGDHGISAVNRLAFRMLLLAALGWVKNEDKHWRYPRLGEITAERGEL